MKKNIFQIAISILLAVLLTAYISPMIRDNLLITAIKHGNSKAVNELVKLGAYPNISIDGTPALVYAAAAGNDELAYILIKNGAYLEKSDALGALPLSSAAWAGHVKIIRLLIESGADINAQTPNGATALWYALSQNHPDAAEILIKKGGVTGIPFKK